MAFFSKRKRKNDDPPRFPAWIIVLIAIGLVIVVELIFQPATSSRTEQVVMPVSSFTLDPLHLTATYIVKQATNDALGTPQAPSAQASNLDPIELTATYIIKVATQQAGTPGS